MAKMFYSMEEVQEKLNCTEDKIKDFVKEGMLREFRDGMKILFKVDEVDTLADSSAAADVAPEQSFDDESLEDISLSLDGSSIGLAGSSIGLAPVDSSDASSLGDSFASDDNPLAGDSDDDDLLASGDVDLDGSSIGIGLAPSATGSADSYGLADSAAESNPLAGDANDYDLSNDDSVGLADEVSMDDESLSNDKDDTVVTSHGIDALEDTELDMDVDPLAQTKISSPFADDDEISLDPSSSGSGLLDLSREADDTSLGADILKDIYSDEMGGDAEEAPVLQSAAGEEEVSSSTSSDMGFDEPIVSGISDSPVPAAAVAARAVQAYDPTSGAFGVMLLIPFIMLIYMAVNALTFSVGVSPSSLKSINDNMMYVTIGAGVLVLLIALYGFFLAGGSATRPERAKKDKPERGKAKAKKEKKQKPKKAKRKRK